MRNSDFLLFLRDFKINTIIGILPEEKIQPQTILLNLELCYKENLVDYATLRENILEIFKNNNFGYLEEALVYLRDFIIMKFSNVQMLNLEISKLEIFPDCIPSIVLKWERK